ncbi:MAE_28990/MAE_18760 family HEPN-like nuclease, partial [Phocaeicola plebeius]|uniref:MAE_28990/MAE_18760 family HEPN-like nuclease n=1 Tax=Phocaeicola plebeius TaxID=310297 RepID=UPI0039786987
FLADIFILSAEKQPIKLSWRKIEWLHIKYSQLESIWNTFGITHDVVTDVKIKGRLAALADNRNAIAHGRELASVIGGRYTISEIECIYNDINTYCSYIITVFEDYITNEMYLIGH